MSEDILMWELEQQDEVEIQERADLIRGLTQGRGVMNPAYDEAVPEKTLSGLDALDQSTLVARLRDALSLMVAGPHQRAISNALGDYVYRDDELKTSTLTERRNWFIEHESDVSYRTLIRHEQEGARALAAVMRIHARRGKETIERLNQRVIDLERMVAWLLEQQPIRPDYSSLSTHKAAFITVHNSRQRIQAGARFELERELKDQPEEI